MTIRRFRDLGWYDADCRRCPRLAAFLDEVSAEYPHYHCRPVPPFGDPAARLLVVGLAPGKHGANASGRPFTGDHAGILLYHTLHRHGFASRPESTAPDDGLELVDCRITNAVKCLPPANKPVGDEVRRCFAYLGREIAALNPGSVVLALGSLAHGAVLRCVGLAPARHPFAHGSEYVTGNGVHVVSSYHCSRYNTQTGRLTADMFDAVFARVRSLVGT